MPIGQRRWCMRQKLSQKWRENWKEIGLFLVVLTIAGLAQGINMFGFPYYENDEGVYLSQALY